MNKDDYQKALGKIVRKRRLELGMSQEDVVKVSGISISQYTRIEAGETNVTVGTLNEIAHALKTKTAKLLPS